MKGIDKITKTENNDRLCQPKTRIAFAKTHKTGSSTIQVNHFHIVSSRGHPKDVYENYAQTKLFAR